MQAQLLDLLQPYHPVTQALIGTLFTWFVTAAGAALVFATRRFSQRVMDGLLGMAAGVMIAASFWSLLAPAIEMSGGAWQPALIGFLAGGACLYVIAKILPHLHPGWSRFGSNRNMQTSPRTLRQSAATPAPSSAYVPPCHDSHGLLRHPRFDTSV